mmetsp:Transcript_27123/g.50615  ORF Transcript_27123/g.50615 Transcript_27123/m.50615 type:complete len:127 (-) Transcript_27123:17-397(-)
MRKTSESANEKSDIINESRKERMNWYTRVTGGTKPKPKPKPKLNDICDATSAKCESDVAIFSERVERGWCGKGKEGMKKGRNAILSFPSSSSSHPLLLLHPSPRALLSRNVTQRMHIYVRRTSQAW